MFKKLLKQSTKIALLIVVFLLLIVALIFCCTQSFFICHVVLPMASYWDVGRIDAQRVDFSPLNGTLMVTKGRYVAKDNSLEVAVEAASVTYAWLSIFSDTPHINTLQINTPEVIVRSTIDKNKPPFDYSLFTIPNIELDSLCVKNGFIKMGSFELKNTLFSLTDFKRGKTFLTHFEGGINQGVKLAFDNQVTVSSKGALLWGSYALSLLHKDGVFENKGEMLPTQKGLCFESESACVLTKKFMGGQEGRALVGKSHQRLFYNSNTRLIEVEKFEGELALGDQNLLYLHTDTHLLFDLKTSKFLHNDHLDLLTLEFIKTPLPIINYLLDLFNVDPNLYFTKGDINGQLSLSFTEQKRFVFKGPLKFEHCQNQSTTLYNIDDGELEFFFRSWVDFEGNIEVSINDLKLQNCGKVDGITGGFSFAASMVNSQVDFKFDLAAKVFPLLYDFYPPAKDALANTFLGKGDFSQTYVKSNSSVSYDYLTQKVDAFRTVFDIYVEKDSLLKIQMASTDTVWVYDFDLISYPSIHHPALKSFTIPQDYQDNCARLLEERYIHLQNRWLLDIDSKRYELQSGKINFYPEKDTRRQNVYVTIDSKMIIDSNGISPLFFSLQGYAPALDCSGMIPTQAEAAQVFCNYFFTEKDIINFDGHFEYYFPNSLLKMYDIYFECPKQDSAYFKISLDTPLENLCGTDTPATDIVIRAHACTHATNFNPALNVVAPYQLSDGLITFDNIFTFSFIDDYFSIDGENRGLQVAFTEGKSKSSYFDFTHKMDVYLTDTHLFINARHFQIFTDSKCHLDAPYRVKLNRLDHKVKALANWTYLDQWVINEFDDLYLHKIKPLQSVQSQGFCEMSLNENGTLDHLSCDLICDSVVLENQALEPLTLMSKFKYDYTDSHFTLDSCYLVVQTGDTEKKLIHLTGSCTDQADSSLFFNLHSKYIHLPTFIEFIEEAKSIKQTAAPTFSTNDSLTLPALCFDAKIQLDSVIISDHFAVQLNSQIHSTPDHLKIENIHILSHPNELFLSMDVRRDSAGILHQKLKGNAKELNLYKLAYFTIQYTDEALEGHLNDIEVDLNSYGNTVDSILYHLEGDVNTDLNDVVIPLETESLVLKIATLPLYVCAQMNQITVPKIMNKNRMTLTDPFVKIATFKKGRLALVLDDGYIYLKTFSLNEGREIYDFKLMGNIQIQDGKLNDCVAIIKPIPITVFAFQVKNTVFDPEVSIAGTMGKTILEGARFYANPFELSTGLSAFGRGLVPVYLSEKLSFIKFWKQDSARIDEVKRDEKNNQTDSKERFLRQFKFF